MATHHPATAVLRNAAKSLRLVLNEPTGNIFREDQEFDFSEAVEAFGFALADFLKEATVSSGGARYKATLIPSFARPTETAARNLAFAARNG